MNIKIYEEKEIHPHAFALLEQHGHHITTDSERAEAILIRTATHADKKFIDRHSKLKYLLRAGAGLDNINIDECRQRGIILLNSAGANANAVAEYTIGLMFAALRKISVADRHVRGGGWDRYSFLGAELQGKTIGLVGFGAIPKLVAKKLQGFDVKILAYDPFLKKEQIEIFPNTHQMAELHHLLQKSQIVSIHVPLVKETEYMIGAAELKLLNPGTVLINTSRGKIVDEEALIPLLVSQKLIAALDVFSEEPLGEKKIAALKKLDNVILTPHIAAMTPEAHEAMAVEVVKKFCEMVKK
ncbi:MAG: hydroxyacid dehydrogenase [Candidatus Woesearchaeota archaeon]|nr:hydroxyacid dehydrogenase [Candidatus Woesearchaeota archaeon]